MFSPEERQRAVDLYFATPMTTSQVVEHLGYPTRQCLERWPAADSRHAGHMDRPIIPPETRTKAIEPVPGGMRQKQAAERLGAGVRAVRNRVKAYREGGMAALRPENRDAGPGRQANDATGSGRQRRRGLAPQGRGAGTGERGDAGGGGGRRKRPGRRPAAPVGQGKTLPVDRPRPTYSPGPMTCLPSIAPGSHLLPPRQARG